MTDTLAGTPRIASHLSSELAFLNPIVLDDLVRVGNPGDGGYVLPGSVLEGTDAVVSFGLSNDWSFEEALSARRPDVPLHAYDHTVGEKAFLRSVFLGLAKFALLRSTVPELRSRLATLAGYRTFFRGNRIHFRERIFNRREQEFDATIDDVFARVEGKSHVLLKMDIEGGEYRVLPDILRYAARIDLMIVEFHDTDPLRPVFIEQARQVCERFDIVHLHGNNYCGTAVDGLPDVLEATFLAKRLVKGGARRDRLPVSGLDYPNNPARPDIGISFR